MRNVPAEYLHITRKKKKKIMSSSGQNLAGKNQSACIHYEGTMGRIFKQLDNLVDKGEDIKHSVKKVVNNYKYKFDVLFEDTSESD